MDEGDMFDQDTLAAPMQPGITRPYRPCPKDFEQRFIELGWDGIKDAFHANTRTIARWLDECGKERLVALRDEHLRATRWPNGAPGPKRAKRYAAGRTLTPMKERRT